MRMNARKVKDQEPYTFVYGAGHEAVLKALNVLQELSDRELTFLLERHMVAARRCELRDAGLVERAGSRGGSMTWRLSKKGQEFLSNNLAAA